METVRIDRLRARYHGVSAEDGVRLDRALAELTETTLEQELARAQLGAEAWAVCIAELSVVIELNPASTFASADAWARAIVSALRDAAEAGGQAGVVVYPTRADAVIDLARGISAHDHRHEWAWRQVGLVAAEPSAAAVRAALLREPRLASVVLGAVGPEAVASLLSPADLTEVATRVVAAVGAAAVVAETSRRTVGELDQDAATRAVLVATTIPAVAWGWARLQSPETVARLAVLAASIAAPSRVRDTGFIASLVSIATGMESRDEPAAHDLADTDEGATAPDRGTSDDRSHPDHARRDPDDDAAERAAEREPSDGADGHDEARTEWGGVWFLVHALTELDVVQALVGFDDADASVAMMEIIASVTGAPADDPAVRWLAGSLDSNVARGPARPDRLDELVQECAPALRGWLERRADGRLSDLGPDRLWRRRGILRRTRGELVLELSLDDVDTTVRIAGLDLDPGWVWWLGAFVRISYV